MNALTCRSCGAGLEAGRIDAGLGVVTCSHCGSLHELPEAMTSEVGAEQPRDLNADKKRRKKRLRAEVALPERFDVKRGQGSLEVSWPAGRAFHGVVLFVIACGFVYVAVSSGNLFLLPVAVGIVYFGFSRVVNRHRVRVDTARVEVSQGPLPWPGAKKLDASAVEQLFVSEHEARVEKGSDGDRRVEVRRYYRLSAATRDSKRVVLLGGLGEPLQALWLEQEIEGMLGIGDVAVAGAHTI